MKALISNIQHFNVHDGNGFRTTVFFQGCPLQCKWCQNPELQSREPVMMFRKALCDGRGYCVRSCKSKALVPAKMEEGVYYKKENCVHCGHCEEVCYNGARTLSSHERSIRDVLEECLRERFFYTYHKGGVTLSGGEPLLQVEFSTELLRRLKQENIFTTVETAGYLPFENIKKAAVDTDIFFFDLKLIDQKKQEKWIGAKDSRILDNLRKLTKIHERIVIRIPLIPEVNDDEEEFGRLMNFLCTMNGIRYVHLLPFHQLGSSKYEMTGMDYEMKERSEGTKESIRRCRRMAEEQGFHVSIGGSGFAYEK